LAAYFKSTEGGKLGLGAQSLRNPNHRHPDDAGPDNVRHGSLRILLLEIVLERLSLTQRSFDKVNVVDVGICRLGLCINPNSKQKESGDDHCDSIDSSSRVFLSVPRLVAE